MGGARIFRILSKFIFVLPEFFGFFVTLLITSFIQGQRKLFDQFFCMFLRIFPEILAKFSHGRLDICYGLCDMSNVFLVKLIFMWLDLPFLRLAYRELSRCS